MENSSNLKRIHILVTGSNKGIGYSIVKKLIQDHVNQSQPQHFSNLKKIYLTTRKMENGLKAKQNLVELYPVAEDFVEVVPLDINSEESRRVCIQKLKSGNVKLDILVNNAGVYFSGRMPTKQMTDVTMNTNFWNTIGFTEEILSSELLSQNGKVIMISSGLGKLSKVQKRNPAIHQELSNYKTDLSMERLIQIAQTCQSELKDNTKSKNWPGSVYGLSKLFLSIWVSLQYSKPSF